MGNFKNLGRLALVVALVLFPALCKAQGIAQGQEQTITYSGSNISVVPPNTPLSRLAPPSGTNTFIIALANPSVTVRVYITNNTANACSNGLTVQLWVASDAQATSFNNQLNNWQTVPLQGSSGTLATTLNPILPANGVSYFSSTAISSSRVVLQVIGSSTLCTNTSIEVTAVISNVAVTSPLISTQGSAFNATNSNQVQGVVPTGQSGGAVNPLIGGAVTNPTNANFATVGIDTFNTSSKLLPSSFGVGTSTLALTPQPSITGEVAIAFEMPMSDTVLTLVAPPYTCANVSGMSCGGGSPQLSVASLGNATLGAPYNRTWTGNLVVPGGGSPGADNTIIVLSSNPNTTVRGAVAVAALSGAMSPAPQLGSTIIIMVGCSLSSNCTVNGVTDTAGLVYKRLAQIKTPNGGTAFQGFELWVATTASPGGADTITVTMSAGTAIGFVGTELANTSPAQLTVPSIPVQADAIGNSVNHPDAQTPNQFTCSVTLSTNTTTQCQVAPITVNNVPVSLYVSDFQIQTTTAGTATTIQLKFGTGTNCGTGTGNLSAITYPNVAIGLTNVIGLRMPLIAPLQNAVCVTQAGTTAGTSVVEIHGWLAP